MDTQETVQGVNRHEPLGLTDGQVIDMYRYMLLARKYDERSLLLQRAGKINFHVSGIGQEAAQVGAAFALDREKDYFLPYYRDYAFVLSVGMTARELLLSVFAKAEDPNSGGRQMPGHFGSKRLRIVTGSSPVTTQVPHAAGFALAAKMRKEPAVSFVTFGEGSSNQGDFHEACNFAGVNKLPVIIMCENNQYAISIPAHRQLGGKVSDRALGYGFPGIRVDGNDPLEVYKTVKEARERALRGEGPTLIEAMMYRLSPHSTSDNDLAYRTKEEVEENWKKDGVAAFRQYLTSLGLWDEDKERDLASQINLELKDAIEYADNAPFPKPEDTLLHVYSESEGGV
ncbi:thiamine pyrophosphate-dependent dehydrogenase E1 component subunit alpha [Paenibacillus sp. HN-1]|uniref:thiamine pyrophosphate-dependent dehydrogenase E1 component subunit alpha n=1 Tax=Paenibacillus TaxID=44249 RepID=UPI001CA94933|nr:MULTISPECIES: thiamine pyrophosphate-dependent dehydrogenase E1 component subunit alpha [Paenibacillus]MBY9081536.1 thiamine pyrophosphate-dependent dehydrogenase E1 component subunit alpha [Paenibacillus sp. CGMCC 1.18879]MBY9087659.1 thiamine pyrophosphate-dependent dehydrogenase E1 component subunit alpha [Paenibacillus sinensis]